MLKWRVGGVTDLSTEEMPSSTTPALPSTATTSTTFNSPSTPTCTISTTTSNISITGTCTSMPSTSTTSSSTTSASISSTTSSSSCSSVSGQISDPHSLHFDINFPVDDTCFPSDSQEANNSFLHLNFVSGSCPSHEYYDGRHSSTIERKRHPVKPNQINGKHEESPDKSMSKITVPSSHTEKASEGTTNGQSKTVVVLAQPQHYSQPLNNSRVISKPPDPALTPNNNSKENKKFDVQPSCHAPESDALQNDDPDGKDCIYSQIASPAKPVSDVTLTKECEHIPRAKLRSKSQDSIPARYYYGLPPDINCTPSHYATPKRRKPVPLETRTAKEHENTSCTLKPEVKQVELPIAHYAVPKSVKVPSSHKLSVREDDGAKPQKSSRKSKLSINLSKAFGQHRKALKKLKELVSHEERPQEKQDEECHYKVPKSCDKKDRQYSKTLPSRRGNKKKKQYDAERPLSQFYTYEPYDFTQDPDDKLKLALDFRDAKTYREVQKIRDTLETGDIVNNTTAKPKSECERKSEPDIKSPIDSEPKETNLKVQINELEDFVKGPGQKSEGKNDKGVESMCDSGNSYGGQSEKSMIDDSDEKKGYERKHESKNDKGKSFCGKRIRVAGKCCEDRRFKDSKQNNSDKCEERKDGIDKGGGESKKGNADEVVVEIKSAKDRKKNARKCDVDKNTSKDSNCGETGETVNNINGHDRKESTRKIEVDQRYEEIGNITFDERSVDKEAHGDDNRYDEVDTKTYRICNKNQGRSDGKKNRNIREGRTCNDGRKNSVGKKHRDTSRGKKINTRSDGSNEKVDTDKSVDKKCNQKRDNTDRKCNVDKSRDGKHNEGDGKRDNKNDNKSSEVANPDDESDGEAHYHTFPRRWRRPRLRPPLRTNPLISAATIPDGIYVDLFPCKNMSALQLAAEGRDYLMWCPDLEFDNAVSALDIRGLVELVQTLQDAMAVEQQTFDSLSQQLEVVNDPLLQQRLSAALCTSQTRLARLCARNMRCFRQQALKVRQREGATSSESRSSSPRDSGLAASSAGPSDTEGDPRSPGVPGGPTFRNSLAFFQRAAHLVANNAKNTSLGARVKETRRRSSRGSSCYGSSSSEAWSVASDDPNTDFYPSNMGGHPDVGGVGGYEDDLLNMEEDPGTYEQVLFINGRPQYQDDAGWSGKLGRSNSWTPVSVDGSSSSSGGTAGPDGHHHHHQPYSVPHSHPSLPGRSAAPSHTDQASVADTNPEEGGSNVTLPRRKPYLNFKSVSSSSNTNSVSDYDRDNLSLFKERIGITKNSALDTLTRTQSFKEGLNHCYTNENSNTSGLSRTQSFNDGLASDFNEFSSSRPKLQRAPSVDEILESVKYLRAKKTMVKSTPDLANVQEPVYSSASLPRHKSSKGKAPRAPGTSSLLGVKYNGHASNPHYERVPEPDYEHIPESSGGQAYYENICKGNNHYENIHLKGEVIYDSPRPTNSHHYDKVHNDLHYENLKYDAPVYENLDEKEPTYMNVKDKSGGKSNVYTKVESNKKSGSLKSIKSRSNKVTVSGNSMLQGATYDVPRAATHIYDSPQKQVRSVSAQQNNEYDTPKNNRSVLPQSTQIVLKSKHDQKKKIDDIFADCDQDSLEGDRDRDRNRDRNRDRDREPDIPSPDYGSEEEEDGFEDATNDYVTSEFPDEGLGESDTRSYYTEDPAGLEVILEEPEEEYCSSHASEDDLQREVDITYELKGERRSLDGSEGIGSAEGDTHSSGGSEHYGEEDCASSGIHSEDTPSPGPPVDSEKDPSRQKEQQKEDRTQKDRCVEVYPETVRQRQRNMMAAANKVDIKNWNSSGGSNNNDDTLSSPSKVKKFLPSVKALRNQFETGKTNGHSNNSTNSNTKPETNGNATTNGNGNVATNINGSQGQSRKSSSSSVASSSVCSTNSLHSPSASVENLVACQSQENLKHDPDEPVEPIFNQFRKVDEELKELMSKPPSTSGWNPRSLLKRLYYIPEAPRLQSQGTTYVNIEGYLEKLPSGRKKATFWNAWKRRYFVAKDGILYYYQGNQTEKPSMKMTLMGGRVESMEPNMVGVDDGSRDSKASVMLGIDDGKGHYVVVRCGSRQEAERWRRALETHTVEDFASQYVQPWPIPTNPALLRETLVIDIGSASIRAGVLASQATLPQVFMPSVVANSREGRRQVWGFDALTPEVRSVSSVAFPIRPSQKISKYSVDLSAVSSLLQKTFAELKVDPKNYHIQLSVPRVLNTNTQAELLRVLFDKHGVRSVNLTHQSILALYAYNATSGIVVDVGERMDIVPVIDGYIVDGGVSRVPYGGYRILDHLRQFLYMRNVSLINEVESYIIRHVLENVCYSANHYNTEKARCTTNSDAFEKTVSLGEYFSKDCPFESITLDFGRFQATEGLFNPDAWGLDHPGLHKLVHKAIMECSMDIRKEMSRSIFLAGGVTQMPGLADRLTTEIDNLTPPAIRPKVHASPYRYHAAYIGACVLAESPAFVQSRVTREDWNKYGNAALRKWSL